MYCLGIYMTIANEDYINLKLNIKLLKLLCDICYSK